MVCVDEFICEDFVINNNGLFEWEFVFWNDFDGFFVFYCNNYV